MNAHTIDADNNITVHATRKAARETGAGVFDTAENLAELIGEDNKHDRAGVVQPMRTSGTRGPHGFG
jgi:hypothetical protein